VPLELPSLSVLSPCPKSYIRCRFAYALYSVFLLNRLLKDILGFSSKIEFLTKPG